MKVIHEFSQENIQSLFALYQQAWWTSTRTFEETKQVVESSQLCFGLINENGSLVGFARVITDFIFKAFIFDVIIEPSYRNKGLGVLLIDSIKSHTRLKNVKHLELYCLPDLEKFYEQLGFTSDVAGVRLMRLIN